MKAIILSAGTGSRLSGMTADKPKGMLEVQGKPLLSWQVEALRSAGFDDIVVVTGHQAQSVDIQGISTKHNPRYATSNMIESLMCAREHMKDGFILSYADIIYEPGLVHALKRSTANIGVVADKEWRRYWKQRFGNDMCDLESFSTNKDGTIAELGRPVDSSDDITHRYVGLLKFSSQGALDLLNSYDEKKQSGTTWEQSGNQFEQGYMTDILALLISKKIPVHVVEVANGWMEFDEPEDFTLLDRLIEQDRVGTTGCFQSDGPAKLRKILGYEFARFDEKTLSLFHQSRIKGAEKLELEYAPLQGTIQNLLKGKDLFDEENNGMTLGWDGHFTFSTLSCAIEKLINSPEDKESALVIHLFQQRFEVTKCLFAQYIGDEYRNGFGPYLYAHNYLLLALGLALLFEHTHNFNYLNTLLKVNDLLLSGILEERSGFKEQFAICLNSEAQFMGWDHDVN